MTDRQTDSVITFRRPFDLGPPTGSLPAGSYRCTVEEELIEGLSFAAFRRVSTTLEIPAIGTASAMHHYISVDSALLDAAVEADAVD